MHFRIYMLGCLLFISPLSLAGERPWHHQLSLSQWSTLQAISGHPALGACLRSANEGNPVAVYHLRNLAQYADSVVQGRHRGEDYIWPANAFRWCLKHANMPLHSGQTSLEALQQRYIDLVQRQYRAASVAERGR